MRTIKFRGWHPVHKRMFSPEEMGEDQLTIMPDGKGFINVSGSHTSLSKLIPMTPMQFVGLYDKNGKEIYESDIFRVEEDGAEDESDMIYYLVVIWIKEWAMFGMLRVADEYHNYLTNGLKALDEPMFWTYNLEDTNSRKFYLCGNIHENSELL